MPFQVMNYDKEKVDDLTLALLYLVMYEEKHGAFAWKGFDWETMNRLHEKGYISNQVSWYFTGRPEKRRRVIQETFYNIVRFTLG